MGKTLTEIAKDLNASDKKVQLIYAFNGTGKTRLSVEFKNLISPQNADDSGEENDKPKFLYYNAFTEDLFYWDNDLENDIDIKLKIHPNSFTYWLLHDEGKDNYVKDKFAHYANAKITPYFSPDFSEVKFSTKDEKGNEVENIKISKGEESCFVWSIFYSMLDLVIDELNSKKEDRSTDKYDDLAYIFIDDPVTSLDENHLIKLAVDLATRIKESDSDLKFIVTTHNPLFYNVMCNELSNAKRYRLEKYEDGTYDVKLQKNDSPFSYHLFLLSKLKDAINSNDLQKYHFNMLRNILEKTSTFLGFSQWGDLFQGTNKEKYITRLINISSHSKVSHMEVSTITDEDKDMLKSIMEEITKRYHFNLQ